MGYWDGSPLKQKRTRGKPKTCADSKGDDRWNPRDWKGKLNSLDSVLERGRSYPLSHERTVDRKARLSATKRQLAADRSVVKR